MRQLIAAARVPFFVIWTAFLVSYVGDPLWIAISSGVGNAATAALLSVAIVWLVRVAPWPTEINWRFAAVHLTAAIMFSVIWALLAVGMVIWIGETVFEGPLEAIYPSIDRLEDLIDNYERELTSQPQILLYRSLLGFWIYASLVALQYAALARAQRRTALLRAAHAEALAARAQAHAVGQHLGQHFLFNALHTVGALIPDDPDRAEQAVENLGELLRYLLRDTDGRVALRDEWSFCARYLELQQLRYDQTIKVTLDCKPNVLDVEVPPLILQPLLENCFKHARLDQSSDPMIDVRARINTQRLELVVRDNGRGSDPIQIGDDTHGLSLLNRRLKLFHSASASMATTSAVGQGFEVRIRLPLVGSGEAQCSA